MTTNSTSPLAAQSSTHTISTFRLRRRTPGSFVLVPFAKGGRSIRCQGQLEAAAAVILANCPLVEGIQEQPLKIHYSWRNSTDPADVQLLDAPPPPLRKKSSQCSYIVPDFLVTMTDGQKHLTEIKPSSKLCRPDVQRKLSVARRYAEQRGWSFHVVTEVELRRGPLLSNQRLLSRYRRLLVEPSLLTMLEELVIAETSTIGKVIQESCRATKQLDARATLLHLIANRRLDVDLLSTPISDQSVLSSEGSISWEPFDSVWGPSGSWTDGPSASSDNLAPTSSSRST